MSAPTLVLFTPKKQAHVPEINCCTFVAHIPQHMHLDFRSIQVPAMQWCTVHSCIWCMHADHWPNCADHAAACWALVMGA